MIGPTLAKSHNSSELEHLKGIIRNLRSENKSLRKQLGRSQKKERQIDTYIPDDIVPDSDDVHIWTEEIMMFKCAKCQKNYKPVELGSRLLHVCTECGWTKSSKKL